MKHSLKFNLLFIYLILFTAGFHASVSSNLIEIEKAGILHKFVHFDEPTDSFIEGSFANWEPETFNAFSYVSNPNGIAIDLGAWIGTTSIWLSKNFYHVIAVEADTESLKCLKMNLEANESSNVTVFERPVAQVSQDRIFGPRNKLLNDSMSYLKKNSDNDLDYITKSITLKQLIYDTIYQNENLKSHPISLIKCDIEGGEEDILEDLLHFAFYNDCAVYLSFRISWWTEKKITDFAYLFKHFDILNVGVKNAVEFLSQRPFASLLLKPKKNTGSLIKENLTAVIIGYNQYTYISNMVSQLEKYTTDIVVIDNKSTYEPLLNYYEKDFKYTLLRQPVNYGAYVYEKNWVKNFTGDIFILTDPDLQFNPDLPPNFIKEFIKISKYYKAKKVGFALLIDAPDIRTDVLCKEKTISEWEQGFWTRELTDYKDSNFKLYDAPIDTTFHVQNRNYSDARGIRVGGNCTCIHIPWHMGFEKNFQPDEYDAYLKDGILSTWFKSNR